MMSTSLRLIQFSMTEESTELASPLIVVKTILFHFFELIWISCFKIVMLGILVDLEGLNLQTYIVNKYSDFCCWKHQDRRLFCKNLVMFAVLFNSYRFLNTSEETSLLISLIISSLVWSIMWGDHKSDLKLRWSIMIIS